MKNEIEKLLKKEASVIEQNIKFDAMETRRNADQLQKVLRKVPLDAWEKSGYHGVKKVEIRKYPRNQGVDVELKIGTCTTRHINNLDSLDYLNLELVAYSQDYLDYCRRKAENLVEILNDIEKSNKFISHLKVNKEYYKMLFREAMPDGQYRVYFTRLNLDNILMKYCQENSINSVTAICKMAKKFTLSVIVSMIDNYSGIRDGLIELLNIERKTIDSVYDEFAEYYKDVMEGETYEQKVEILDWFLKGPYSMSELYEKAINNRNLAWKECSEKEKYLFHLSGVSDVIKENTLTGKMKDKDGLQFLYLDVFTSGYIAGWMKTIFLVMDVLLNGIPEIKDTTVLEKFYSIRVPDITEKQKEFLNIFYKVYKRYMKKDVSEYDIYVNSQTEEFCELSISNMTIWASGKNKEEALENLRNKFEEEKECLIIQWINSDYFPEKDLLEFIKSDTQEESNNKDRH